MLVVSVLCYCIENSMEVISACHPALCKEWLDWVAICANCDLRAQANKKNDSLSLPPSLPPSLSLSLSHFLSH